MKSYHPEWKHVQLLNTSAVLVHPDIFYSQPQNFIIFFSFSFFGFVPFFLEGVLIPLMFVCPYQ